MKFIRLEGIRMPTFGEFTFAVALAVILWAIVTLTGFFAWTAVQLGGLLVAMLTGTISSAFGIRMSKGFRYAIVHLIICVATLAAYVGAVYLVSKFAV